jgi:GT2 family glycosyltransferase
LFNTLAALARLDARPDSFEVIVVDDGSPDPVVLPKLDVPLRLVRQLHGGPGRARNCGARQARAPLLIFLDDDCAPERDWLREISARVTPTAAIGGSIRNALRNNRFAEASHLLTREFIFAQRSPRTASFEFLPTANLAVPSEAFWRREDFPLAAGEDRDFCRRWRQNGYRLLLSRTAIVNHLRDMRGRDFVRQHYHYGQGARFFYNAHREAPRMSVPFYSRLLRAVFKRGTLRQVASLGGLVAVSQASTAIGYVCRVLRDGSHRSTA